MDVDARGWLENQLFHAHVRYLQRVFHVGSAVVRWVQLADLESVVELGRLVDPTSLATTETFRALLGAESPRTTERLVAESGGRI